jgi:hypothetical protein
VERENAFFKSSPIAEYHLPQMNFEKVLFGVIIRVTRFLLVLRIVFLDRKEEHFSKNQIINQEVTNFGQF